MRRVFWSKDALHEFDQLIATIARDNPAAATVVADRIEKTIKASAVMPIGRKGRVAGTYATIVTGLPYIIAYALGSTPGPDETLTVLRIIHGARDWPEGRWPEPA